MSARTAEIMRIKSPIKKEVKHLGGNQEEEFSELINKSVRWLRKYNFKLVHVTKSYRKKDSIRADSFWRKEKKVGNIKVVWLCTFTVDFDSGFELIFDFDFWFDLSKFSQNLRGDLYEKGFPYTNRSYAKEFGKKEVDRTMKEVRGTVIRSLRRRIGGWGKHGIISEVTERRSLDICHRKEFSLSSVPEFEKLRENLRDGVEEPVGLVENLEGELEKEARNKIEDVIPFSLEADSLESHLAFFLWFRQPGGGFEYQLFRFVQENYGLVEENEIEEALLRLEVHGYTDVSETPEELRKEMEKRGIKRCRRFYELGKKEISGKELFRSLKRKTRIGAYLSPLPRKRLTRQLDGPNHLVEKKIQKLKRTGYITERKVKDFSGRTVKKIKPRRNPKRTNGLKRKIMEKSQNFYDVQKSSLDELQEERPV
ncbi:hypothetical protein AKJ41_02500 [candidate division MSBL1 archaeon SCGC-AAA259O05]|uniref:Uncharacterized protein n=1 Tax=candidate division MSBL1 archaeon SCGC-AAA259O05 TaxID=1698271 RepID=A0A133V400_9EURY|nr:hypothetical protein AKJ41_02500 [candidate division MSBL1 archaeon SCGC-AAA259O05]